jgi:hypothetical protein
MAVLNTFTEHNFQHAFKKWQKRWERCIREKGNYFEGEVVSRSKVSFNQMVADRSGRAV